MTAVFLAYVIAGMIHFCVLLRHDVTIEGDVGRFYQGRLLRARPQHFLGVVVTWPVAISRRPRPWIAPEAIAFVIAIIVLLAV